MKPKRPRPASAEALMEEDRTMSYTTHSKAYWEADHNLMQHANGARDRVVMKAFQVYRPPHARESLVMIEYWTMRNAIHEYFVEVMFSEWMTKLKKEGERQYLTERLAELDQETPLLPAT